MTEAEKIEAVARWLCRWSAGWTGAAREDEWMRHYQAAADLIRIVSK